MRCLCVLATTVTLQMIVASLAAAQTAGPSQRHRFEIAAGGLWVAGAALGSDTAELRANRTPAAPFALFTADTRSAPAPGFDGRLAYWLTRSIAIEGGFAFMKPALRTRVSSDVENAAALTLEERVDQYFIDGSVVWLLDALRFGDRTIPFVSGGAGYLRQLHQGRTLIETGTVYNAGGGLRHWLRLQRLGWIRAIGLRVDGRVYVLVDGVRLEDRPRTHGAVSGAVFLTF